MARNSKVTKKSGTDRRSRAGAAGRPKKGRPKVCLFCAERATWVDYKDIGLLRKFVNDRGRIRARGATGTCAQHQRDVATAVKTARELALLPYSVRTVSSERGGRGGDRRPPREDQAAEAPTNAADGAAEDVEDDEEDEVGGSPAESTAAGES